MQLQEKIDSLPESLQHEVDDFIDFLLEKHQKHPKNKRPVFGSSKGFYTIANDFDEPLEDFNEYTS